MVTTIFRSIVVVGILVSLAGLLLPIGDTPDLGDGIVLALFFVSTTGLVLYVIACIGLLKLKKWGWFAYLVVVLIDIFLAFFFLPSGMSEAVYFVVAFFVAGVILILPLVNKSLKREFFGG